MIRLISHRGHWWPRPELQNQPDAFAGALERGWGVELLVRLSWCFR